MFSCDWRKFAYGNTNSSCVKSCRSVISETPISQFGPLVFLIPLLPKHLFSPSLSHNMKAMYSTMQFHRQNILSDQQISQKHTFNRPFSARYDNTRWMGLQCECGGAELSWADGVQPAPCRHRICVHYITLRKHPLLFSLWILLFWDVNIMGLGYSWWNIHLQIY